MVSPGLSSERMISASAAREKRGRDKAARVAVPALRKLRRCIEFVPGGSIFCVREHAKRSQLYTPRSVPLKNHLRGEDGVVCNSTSWFQPCQRSWENFLFVIPNGFQP